MDKEAEKLKKQESTYSEAMEALNSTIDRLSKENETLQKKLRPFEERGGRKFTRFSPDATTGESSAVDAARIGELHYILRTQKEENAALKAKLAGVGVYDLKLVRNGPSSSLKEQFAAARQVTREFALLAASSTVVDLTKGPRRAAFTELEGRKEALLQKRQQAEEIETKIKQLVPTISPRPHLTPTNIETNPYDPIDSFNGDKGWAGTSWAGNPSCHYQVAVFRRGRGGQTEGLCHTPGVLPNPRPVCPIKATHSEDFSSIQRQERKKGSQKTKNNQTNARIIAC